MMVDIYNKSIMDDSRRHSFERNYDETGRLLYEDRTVSIIFNIPGQYGC